MVQNGLKWSKMVKNGQKYIARCSYYPLNSCSACIPRQVIHAIHVMLAHQVAHTIQISLVHTLSPIFIIFYCIYSCHLCSLIFHNLSNFQLRTRLENIHFVMYTFVLNMYCQQLGEICQLRRGIYICLRYTFVSFDRSSYSDDGQLYIRGSSHFFRFSLSPLIQLMLQVSL